MVKAWDSSLVPFDPAEEEEMEQAIKARTVSKPHLPTQKEVEEHMKTHTPFKAWCPHCVAGHSSCGHHLQRKKEDEDHSVPVVHMDYMYMKSVKEEEAVDPEVTDDQDNMPVLVMSDQKLV